MGSAKDNAEEPQWVKDERKRKAVYLDKIRGSLFGGAVGDALGYPVEFMKEDAIFKKYGKKGIVSYEKHPGSGKALISDDTQMSLFTANGILVGDTRGSLRGIAADPAGYIYDAYLDWYTTQEGSYNDKEGKHISWLLNVPELFAVRVPGNTCMSALEELKYRSNIGYPEVLSIKRNDSKGNGGLMRVAPLALFYGSRSNLDDIDKEGGNTARITHCHSLGYMPAAALVHIISRIVYPQTEMSLEDIIKEAKEAMLRIYEGDENLPGLIAVIDLAMKLAANTDDDLTNIHKIGAGWVAEETLGIALYCALRYRNDFSGGIIAAVNHNGDSDTTGAVAGNILGALCGYEAIEEKWKQDMELSDVILEIADDLCYGCMMDGYSDHNDEEWLKKY